MAPDTHFLFVSILINCPTCFNKNVSYFENLRRTSARPQSTCYLLTLSEWSGAGECRWMELMRWMWLTGWVSDRWLRDSEQSRTVTIQINNDPIRKSWKSEEGFKNLTSESPVDSLDSPVQNTAASLLNPAGCCSSDPVLSDVRSSTSELRPRLHSESLRVDHHRVCN